MNLDGDEIILTTETGAIYKSGELNFIKINSYMHICMCMYIYIYIYIIHEYKRNMVRIKLIRYRYRQASMFIPNLN